MNDNIVAYWVPDEPVKPGESRSFSYTVHWQRDKLTGPELGRVTATRLARTGDDRRDLMKNGGPTPGPTTRQRARVKVQRGTPP